jgi:putative transposase
MELSISLRQTSRIFKGLKKDGVEVLGLVKEYLRSEVKKRLDALLELEITIYLGRDRHERIQDGEEKNYRNGHLKERNFTIKGLGTFPVKVPRDRNGEFESRIIPKRRRSDWELKDDLQLLFLSGISTRKIAELSDQVFGCHFSSTEVSKAMKLISDQTEQWRVRWLSGDIFEYLYVDGVNFHIRRGKSIEIEPVLVVLGVTRDGVRKVIGLQAGDKECASSWREMFKDLKQRGLKHAEVLLGIMDGLPGLERVFKEEFSNAWIQRCQVHKQKNVLAKVTRKHKKLVADDIRSIFYAEDKETAYHNFDVFKKKWETQFPDAVNCLEKDLDACLTFFDFPKEHWAALRTTNIIERLNKEYKRRTKVMEILAGEVSCYRLLYYISMRMEKRWKGARLGVVGNALAPNLYHKQKAA